MHYSLIIPAWNEAALLPGTLASISQVMQQVDQLGIHHGELIVVDNNSSDGTAEIARAAGATVVFEPVNQIAKARNRGTTVAAGSAFVFLDADSLCSATLLNHALDRLATDRVVGGGSVIAPDQVVLGTASHVLRFWNWLSRNAGLAAGCFIFCRRDAFEAVGGFNDKVYAGEEIYLSRRLKRWSRKRGMSFDILAVSPVITSVRKLHWYGSAQLTVQALLVLIPGAVYSRHLCRTWYDRSRR